MKRRTRNSGRFYRFFGEIAIVINRRETVGGLLIDSPSGAAHASSASIEIKRATPEAMWLVPEFVISLFGIASREGHLAIAKDAFDLLVADGENALRAGDIDEHRSIVRRILSNQIASASMGDIRRLASVLA